MPRYILIDHYSGYIWGDSADLNGKTFDGAPMEFAKALDESLNEYGRTYDMRTYVPRDGTSGYHVYRADIDGDETVPVITDGQDAEQISAVTDLCRWEGFIAIHMELDD